MEDIAGLLGRTYTNVNMVDCSHVGDITVDGCEFNGTCGYVGGVIGSTDKEDTEDDFINFYYQGITTVKHNGKKYFGHCSAIVAKSPIIQTSITMLRLSQMILMKSVCAEIWNLTKR